MPDPISRELVIGVLSLILWSLVLIVTVKYVLILLEADNNGEGGSLTLVALAQRTLSRRSFSCCSWAWPAPPCSTATR